MVSKAKWALNTAIFVFFAFLARADAVAQTELVSGSYFPAELEFKELPKVFSEESGDNGAALAGLKEAPIFAEAGFLHYTKRTYVTDTGSNLSIEVLTARDEKAAYSLLTLLRDANISVGPPGDAFAASEKRLIFASGPFWVRIGGQAPADLFRRIAVSVSNRIGTREHSIPSLVSRLPQQGLDSSTVRYFLGPISVESYGSGIPRTRLAMGPEMELAQAQYSQAGQMGTLSLIGFPTSQAAESYFDSLSLPDGSGARDEPRRSYARRVGPIVGILEGGFDATAAGAILRQLKFSYSIRWIYDKNNRSSATVWGVPVGILGTVVRSLLLTALLCGMSLLLGVGLATFRLFLRGYAPNNFLDRPERTEMIRLRLNEGSTRSPSTRTGMSQNP